MTDPYATPSIWHDKEEAWHEVMPGVSRRVATHATTGMMIYYKIASGSVFAWHNHPHSQFGLFLQGGGIFKVGDREWRVKGGDGYFIPPGVFHELRTDGGETCVVVDFFTPERDDYAQEALNPDPV
jgi:quercetin dioxygenase-like cupin family protein